VKVKERVKGKEVESESERACDFTDVVVSEFVAIVTVVNKFL
jgi:hypothetical protein